MEFLACLAFITLCHEFNHLLVRWLGLKSAKQPFFMFNEKDNHNIVESGDAWESNNIRGRLGVAIVETHDRDVHDIVYYKVTFFLIVGAGYLYTFHHFRREILLYRIV